MAKGAVAKVGKMAKQAVEKVEHNSKLRVCIGAGLAMPNPPLGPQLGQRNINVANFCKEFNEKTAHIKEGTPIPCRVKTNPDRSFTLVMHNPLQSYYIKQAAGIQVGRMDKECAGKITLKHVYEIAKIKAQDPPMAMKSMVNICNLVIGQARSIGVEVVRDYDPEEYAKFLEEKKAFVAAKKKELQEIKEAKMLRTG